MKKYFLSLVAMAAMLFATSCQESIVEPQMEGPTTFTVQLPDGMGTKAEIGSANTVNQLFVSVYAPGCESTPLSSAVVEKAEGDGTFTVSFNLIQDQTYDLIFWAQTTNAYVDKSSNENALYDLRKIDISERFYSNENGAAFYAYQTYEIDGQPKEAILKRPFAQLNIGTTVESLKTDADSDIILEGAKIEVKNVASSFNTVTGYGEGDGTTIYGQPSNFVKVAGEDIQVNNNQKYAKLEVEGKPYVYVTMDYLPIISSTTVPKDLVEIKLLIDTDQPTVIEHNFDNVPVQRNYRTNIVGNLISSTTDFIVKVSDDWAGEDYKYDSETGKVFVEVGTADELEEAILNPEVGEVVLTNDINLTETLVFGAIQGANPIARASESAQRRDFIFDGNGKTLTSTAARAINISGVDGVTIKNLTIECTGERAINIIQNATNVTIDKVTATAANYTVNVAKSAPGAVVNIVNSTLNGLNTVNVASPSANVTVNNSTVNCNDNNTTAGESYAAFCLNKDAVGGEIEVTNSIINVTEGSDSYKAKNGAEDGIITIDGSDDEVVITVAVITFEGSPYYYGFASLESAIEFAKDGETITLIRDIEQVDGVLITDKNITIDLNGKTYTVTEGASTNNRNFKIDGSSIVTIKNGTMIAKGEITSGAYGTIRTEGTANVTLENVSLYSYRGYGLNVKALTGTTVKINNSEIYSQYSGGVEAAGGTIELTNVKIDQKGVYSGAAWCSVAIGVNGGGKVVVNSGEYQAATISTDANAAQGTWVAYVMSSGGTLEINGGTFNGIIAETASAANACGIICADRAAVVNINGGTFNSNGAILDMRNNVGTLPNPVATLAGGVYSADPRVSGLYASNLIQVAEGYVVNLNANGTYTVIPTILKDGAVLDLGGVEYNGTITVEGNVTIKGDTKIKTLKSTTGCTITIEDGKTLTLNNFSFGSTETAGKEYEIKGGTVVANYGFFQHGTYALRSNFETGYMYYSFGSDITVYGIFHSQGKGDGLDYVRGKLTIAKGGKSIHDKSLWVGQPASWGAMNASLIIEEDGYLQANSLSVYEGSSLTYSKDEDLKYNNVTGTEYIIKK